MRTKPGEGRLFRTKKTKIGPAVGSYRFWFRGRRYNTGTQDYDEALRKLATWLPELRRGQPITEQRPATMNDLFQLVERDYARKGRRTTDRLDSRLKRLRRELGAIPSAALITARIEDYVASLREDGLKNATINRDLETLRRAFRLGLQRTPPLIGLAPHIELLPENNGRNVDLSTREYRALIEFLEQRDPAVRLMTIIAYHVGWRAEPIKSLRKLQVDFDAMMIHPPGRQAENKKVGVAPIYGELARELRLKFSFDEVHFPTVPWVVHRGGEPVRSYRSAWTDARAFIGRPDLRFHDLRGIAESNMLEAGLDEAYVMHTLGHKTRASVDRYRRITRQRNDRARQKLEEFQDSQNQVDAGPEVLQ